MTGRGQPRGDSRGRVPTARLPADLLPDLSARPGRAARRSAPGCLAATSGAARPSGPMRRGQHADDSIAGVQFQFLKVEVGELLGFKVVTGPLGKRVAAPECADG